VKRLFQIGIAAPLIMLLLSGSATINAQEATPSPILLPEAEAPYGLASVTLPQTEAEIEALFQAMPAAVAGQQRASTVSIEGDRIVLSYGVVEPGFGPPLYIQAIDLSRNDFFPEGFTTGLYVATVAGIPDFGAMTYGQDGNLAWVLAASSVAVVGENEATPVAERPIYTLTWGYADSNWLFSSAAVDPAGLEALAFAFVLTASAQPIPATPAAA
jgi:hypothetical protein